MAEDNSPILTRKRVLAAKQETTTGTPISLAAADAAFNIYNPVYTPPSEIDERETQGGFAYAAGVPGPFDARITFECDFAGSGTTGVPLWADTFLTACGMTKTSTTFAFAVTSTLKTLTIGFYEGGLLRQISGAVGNWTLPLVAGRHARIRFEFLGKEVVDSDVALLSPTLPTVIPPRWANASAVAFGSFTPRLSRLEITAGNQLERREDANDLTGLRSGIIVDRKVRATADPEAALVADRDWQAIYRASTTEAFSCVIGTAANNIMTVAGAAAQVFSRGRGERNKITTEDVTLAFLGESPLTIAFT